jgi:parallel beta helix pectate lyase-like protein
MKYLSLLVAVIFWAAPSYAQIYVAEYGNDQGPGNFSQPFETLARAQLEVRNLRQAHPDRGVVVMLRRGIYRLQQPLVFGPEDGGDETHAVLWSVMPGEYVVISGGRVIDDWSVEEGDVFRAPLPGDLAGTEVRDVYLAARRLPRARHPNKGWLRVDQAGQDRRTSFSFAPGSVPDIPALPESADGAVSGLEVHLLHDWSSSRIPVSSIDAAAGILHTRAPIGCAANHYAIDHFEPHPRFMLEGHRALMDSQGEWIQDPASGDLLVKAPLWLEHDLGGFFTADTLALEVPVLDRLLEIRGVPGNPVRNLHFSGIIFQTTAFTPPVDGWAGAQASMHERRDGSAQAGQRIFVPAAIHMEYAAACSIEKSVISRIGGTAVWVGTGCRDVALRRITIQSVGANAINIGEDGSRLVDGKAWWKSSGPDDPALARRISVEGCWIESVGMSFPGAVGIWIGFAADCTIAYNDIHKLPYTGISLGWVWAQDPSPIGGHLIANNDISRVMQVLSDGGCIYTLGRQPGTVIRGNHLHDLKQQAGRAPSNGIFMDEGSTEILVEANRIDEIDQAPIRFHRAGANRIVGNALITSRESAFQYNRTDPTQIEFVDNFIHPKFTQTGLKIGLHAGTHWYIWSQIQAQKGD